MLFSLMMDVKYGDPAWEIYPGVDAGGAIELLPGEGDKAIYRVDLVDEVTGSMDVVSMKELPPLAWEACLTDCRIAFRTPYVQTITGKGKEKRGRETVGQLPYSLFTRLGAFMLNNAQAVLAIEYIHSTEGAGTVMLHSRDIEAMRALLADLHSKVGAHVKALGNWLSADHEKYQEGVKRWESFPVRAWGNPQEEERAVVPSSEYRYIDLYDWTGEIAQKKSSPAPNAQAAPPQQGQAAARPPASPKADGASNAPDGAVVCASCGSAVPSGARFCTKCGAPATGQLHPVCKACGQPLQEGSRFCGECGAAVGE